MEASIVVASFVPKAYRTLSEAAERAEGVKSRGIIKRFFTSNSDAKKLQGLIEGVNAAIQDFVVSTDGTSLIRRSLIATQVQTILVINLSPTRGCRSCFRRVSMRTSTLCVGM